MLLSVHDAHPGLVWTPMLTRQLPGGATTARWLERSGLARALFKTPRAGAATVLVAALDPSPPSLALAARSGGAAGRQLPRAPAHYYVNGRLRPSAASPESADLASAERMWREAVVPSLNGIEAAACAVAPLEAAAERKHDVRVERPGYSCRSLGRSRV